MNISPLISIISLMFWGLIWGTTGMIVSVPFTVVVIIILSEIESTRPLAILLSEKGDINERDSLNENFWNNRYLDNNTGWDIGAISPAIKKWFDTKKNKDLQILIPGAGKGHEVKYGFDHGFKNIHYLDISSRAVTLFKDNCPNFPKEQILISDFFDLKKDLFFDVVIEQTFFCAISPVLRKKTMSKNT